MLAHLDGAAKITPGVWIFCGTVKAGCKLGPACLAPVEPTLAFVTEQAHHLLQHKANSQQLEACDLAGMSHVHVLACRT